MCWPSLHFIIRLNLVFICIRIRKFKRKNDTKRSITWNSFTLILSYAFCIASTVNMASSYSNLKKFNNFIYKFLSNSSVGTTVVFWIYILGTTPSVKFNYLPYKCINVFLTNWCQLTHTNIFKKSTNYIFNFLGMFVTCKFPKNLLKISDRIYNNFLHRMPD